MTNHRHEHEHTHSLPCKADDFSLSRQSLGDSLRVNMSWSIVISLLIGAVLLLVLWIKNKYSYWKERGFESVDGSFPFGSLKGVGFTVHFSQVTKKIYDDYKGKAKAVGLYFFTSPTVLLIDLDVVKHVLIKDFHNFSDRGLYFNAKSDPLSAHLFAIEGEMLGR